MYSKRYVNSDDLQGATGVEVLCRTLSIQTIVVINSSFAEDPPAFREIGEGLQGTIFQQVDKSSLVMKKEKPQNSAMSCNLRNEFQIHRQVSEAFGKFGKEIPISVPGVNTFIASETNTSWPTLLPMLPKDCQIHTDIVEMERILPLPKIIRRALIQEFYPFPPHGEGERHQLTEATLSITSNKDCLIRPYLGVHRMDYDRDTFSLRNFKLGFEDLRRYEVNLTSLSKTMGRAYAVLHWVAHVNGDDVEFVFGSSIDASSGRDSSRTQHRNIGLYLIDFGQCDKVDMAMSPEDVYQAFRGAMVTGDNACFIPNHRHTPELYHAFKLAYSGMAKQILVEDSPAKNKFNIDQFMETYQEYVEELL